MQLRDLELIDLDKFYSEINKVFSPDEANKIAKVIHGCYEN